MLGHPTGATAPPLPDAAAAAATPLSSLAMLVGYWYGVHALEVSGALLYDPCDVSGCMMRRQLHRLAQWPMLPPPPCPAACQSCHRPPQLPPCSLRSRHARRRSPAFTTCTCRNLPPQVFIHIHPTLTVVFPLCGAAALASLLPPILYLSFAGEFSGLHPAWPPHYLFLSKRLLRALSANGRLKVSAKEL